MKKTYIRPESQLFLINLAENIAASGGSEPGGGGSSDFIQDGIVLHFSQYVDGCRGIYTNDTTAIVRVPSTAGMIAYLSDYYQYVWCAIPDHKHTAGANGCLAYA